MVILPMDNKLDITKTSKIKGKSFVTIWKYEEEFVKDFKEDQETYALVIKGEETHEVSIPQQLQS